VRSTILLRALRWYVHPGQPASAPVRFAGGREPTLHLNGSHARLRRRAGAWRGLTVYSSAAPYWPVAAARRARPSSGLGPVEQARHSFGKRSRRPCAGDDGSARWQISWLSTSKLTSDRPALALQCQAAASYAPPAWSHHVPDVDVGQPRAGSGAAGLQQSGGALANRQTHADGLRLFPTPPCNHSAALSTRGCILGVQRGCERQERGWGRKPRAARAQQLACARPIIKPSHAGCGCWPRIQANQSVLF
jgi:hypothetical protein